MIQNIMKWFMSFFYTAAPQAARIAGVYVARNNKDKVAEILPLAETALDAAKSGRLDQKQMKSVIEQINKKVGDPEFQILLSAIEIPALEVGTVNSRAILILEAFIDGCKAGVK